MLEKITNINLRSELFNGKKAVSAYKNSSRNNILKNDLHDSVNLSPAYRFLSQLDWKLKEMKKLTTDKIYVAFFFSGYEFQTTIDLSNPAKLNSLEYNVINNSSPPNPPMEGGRGGLTITASLSVSINKQKIVSIAIPTSRDVLTELQGMKILFYRLSSLNLNLVPILSGRDNFNNNILFELFDGILSIVNKEFDYINSCLFAFIEKILNIKIAPLYPPRKLSGEKGGLETAGSASLNKIKLLNVDVRKN